jgi:ribosomal protein L37AE/L43A
MRMAERLSREMFFPDCPHCERPGWAAVVRSESDPDWRCEHCGESFDSPTWSLWHGACDLPEREFQVYVDYEIRELSFDEIASGSRQEPQIRGLLSAAKNRIGDTGHLLTAEDGGPA